LQGKTETRVGFFILMALGIFLYMGFKIGVFRFDRGRYASYTVFFEDISGLSRKAMVTVAGVNVGWVAERDLVSNGDVRAKVGIMIRKDYKLYDNASAVVRQEGMLGPKYLEIVPGDPLLSQLPFGATLREPTESPVSIDELLRKFQKIAGHVEQVTDSFRDAVGGAQGKEQLRNIFNNLDRAASKIASFSDIIDRSISNNEGNINTLLAVGNDIRSLSRKLEGQVLPAFQSSMERISDVFDRDFDRIATKLEATGETIEDASIQAREGLRSISSVAQKIDEGKGLLGKLINEDETYRDLKVAVQGLKNYFSQVDRLEIVFDSHFEGMYRPAENYEFEDSKGYFDVRIHPNDDHFYILQLAASQKGFMHRREIQSTYCDDERTLVDTRPLSFRDKVRLNVFRRKEEILTRNTFKLGLQFGKVFNNIAVRLGLFEGSAGVGIDFDIPFSSDKFRWVTSLEAFDFVGWNRRDDRRPHLKWINRMFILRNLYVTFGADDFVSSHNANAFFGAGIRFGDDDVKYLISSFGSTIGNNLNT